MSIFGLYTYHERGGIDRRGHFIAGDHQRSIIHQYNLRRVEGHYRQKRTPRAHQNFTAGYQTNCCEDTTNGATLPSGATNRPSYSSTITQRTATLSIIQN